MTISDNELIKTWRKSNKKGKKIIQNPHPFVKWAGGKRQLLSQLDRYIPNKFNKYIEPFVGGGALFFYLLPKEAILMDINAELMNCYNVIKNDVFTLIDSLDKHKNEKTYYYTVRNEDRIPNFSEMTDVDRASRTIYLNRCCYNGLYRVNKNNQFNVPFGRYKNPKFLDKENLIAVNKSLQNVTLMKDSFEVCQEYADKEDFIYFDPPYYPLSSSANFTSYTKDNFNTEMQEKLYETFKNLDRKGCKVMLSNSFSDFITNLYSDYHINILQATRAINSNASKRGKINEVLITNYPV